MARRVFSASSLYQLSPSAVLYSPQLDALLADSGRHQLLAEHYYKHLAKAWADNIESVVDANTPQVLQWLYDRRKLPPGVLIRAATQAAKNDNGPLVLFIQRLWDNSPDVGTMALSDPMGLPVEVIKDFDTQAFKDTIITELVAINSSLLLRYFDIRSAEAFMATSRRDIQQLQDDIDMTFNPTVAEALRQRRTDLENKQVDITADYWAAVRGAARGRQGRVIDAIARDEPLSAEVDTSWYRELYHGYVLAGQLIPASVDEVVAWSGTTRTPPPPYDDDDAAALSFAVEGGNINNIRYLLHRAYPRFTYWEALIQAVRHNHADILESLVQEIDRRGMDSEGVDMDVDWLELRRIAKVWRRRDMLSLLLRLEADYAEAADMGVDTDE